MQESRGAGQRLEGTLRRLQGGTRSIQNAEDRVGEKWVKTDEASHIPDSQDNIPGSWMSSLLSTFLAGSL